MARLERREIAGIDQSLNAAGDARLASDAAFAFQSYQHLIDRGRGDTKEALQVGMRRRSAKHHCVGMDEGQILTLLGREAR